VITVRTPTGDKEAATFTVRTPSGDAIVATITVRTADGDKVAYTSAGAGSLDVTVSPISAVGAASSTSTVTVTSNLVTASVSNGTPPYTFAWTRTSGSSAITATTPAAAATRFSGAVAPGNDVEAEFLCTVTDARGRTGTATAPASLVNFSRIFL
jgi:hypothetical protein